MEHIRRQTNEPLPRSRAFDFYFQGRRIGVLDIETTGLDRRRDHFILGGLYLPAEGILHQVFAENLEEEAAALKLYMQMVNACDTVITYNGRHFDLPFLEQRCARHLPGVAFRGYDLDLYQVVNGHSPMKALLPNLKQKTVETYMGLWPDRADEISGAESVQLYYDFLHSADPVAREKILLHNSDDVQQLTRLLAVLHKSDFHKAMFHMGFPVGQPCASGRVTKIRFDRDILIVSGSQGGRGIRYRGYSFGNYPLRTIFLDREDRFEMIFPVIRQQGIAAIDLRAAGLEEKEFEKYPGFGSGFLVLQEHDAVQYMQLNHFVKAFFMKFEKTVLAHENEIHSGRE